MIQLVKNAGICGGYSEDLFYNPQFLKSLQTGNYGLLGKILWTKSREGHPFPHSDWFWDK